MSWERIGENLRCQGRSVDNEGRRGKRCRTILWIGTRFWLDGINEKNKRLALCPECAANPEVPKVTCPSSVTTLQRSA